MLDELSFYQYFYNLDEELHREKIKLEKAVKNNPYNYCAIERLRDIRIQLQANNRIYNDLKGFYK